MGFDYLVKCLSGEKHRNRSAFFNHAIQAIGTFVGETAEVYQGRYRDLPIIGAKAYGTYCFDLRLRQFYDMKVASWFVAEMFRKGKLGEFLDEKSYTAYTHAFYRTEQQYQFSQKSAKYGIDLADTNVLKLRRRYDQIFACGPEVNEGSDTVDEEIAAELVAYSNNVMRFGRSVGDFCKTKAQAGVLL